MLRFEQCRARGATMNGDGPDGRVSGALPYDAFLLVSFGGPEGMADVEPFLDHVLRWCGQITRNPPTAVFAAKRAIVDGLGLPLDEGLRLEARLFSEVNASPLAQAANAAFPRSLGG